MNPGKSYFYNSFILLFIFYGSLLLLFYFIEKIFFTTGVFAGGNFLNWDAMHYDTIRKDEYKTGMVAFFPLFPFTWKLLHTGPVGISIFNCLLFIFSFSWLAMVFNIGKKNLLLLASVPSLIFMFLPFSEAMFFMASVALLAGLKKNNLALAAAGIFVSGIARPVATIFIPALLMLWYLSDAAGLRKIKETALLISCCLASLASVFLLQYFQTGDWLAFVHVQKGWGNYLRLPSFPLNSWAGGFILRLDAMTFFFGMAAAAFIIYMRFVKFKTGKNKFESTLIFSVCYLAFLSLIILLTRGGILNSLNRYLFCSAFFILAMHRIFQEDYFNGKNVLLLVLASGIFWLVFGSYVHIQTLIKFELLSVYLVLLLAMTSQNKIWRNTGYYSVLITNIAFMLIFFHRFLSGSWVG